jgi:hypothetical protein
MLFRGRCDEKVKVTAFVEVQVLCCGMRSALDPMEVVEEKRHIRQNTGIMYIGISTILTRNFFCTVDM